MPDTEVLDSEAQDKPAVSPKDQKAETVTISKSDYERMERERKEAAQDARYWAERARGGKPEVAEEEEDEESDDDLIPEVTGKADIDESIFNDPEKWVAAVSKGPAAIQALIRKEGYLNGKQVLALTQKVAEKVAKKISRETVDSERSKITTDNKLMTRFPELANNESEFFKATAEEYKDLIAFDPKAEKNPATLFAAAKAAEARLKAAKAAKPRVDEDDDVYERPDEEERRARVHAQDGSRGGRRPSRSDDSEDSLGPQTKAVLAGFGLTEDKYRASRKELGATRSKR